MKNSKRGQSIIEYALIAVLVILGIVVMGPYVLRSVNAHFKMWDDQVQDSFNDPLNQDPVPPPCPTCPKCECSADYVSSTCGFIRSKTVTCQQNERYQFKTCKDPQNCSPTCAIACSMMERCVSDDTCCIGDIKGECGVAPRDQAHPSNACWYGEREIDKRCGARDKSFVRCVEDTTTDDGNPDCSAKCLGNLPMDGDGNFTAEYCPGADQNLNTPTPITFLGGSCQTFSYQPGIQQWSVPTGTTKVKVAVWAAGGGGAGSTSVDTDQGPKPLDGSGGGGGALATGTINVKDGETYQIIVGKGGAGGTGGSSATKGGDGGVSTFSGPSGTITAYGGKGGDSSKNGANTSGSGGNTMVCTGEGCNKFDGGQGSSATPQKPAGCAGGGSGGGGKGGISAFPDNCTPPGNGVVTSFNSIMGNGGDGLNLAGNAGGEPGGGGAGGGQNLNGGDGGNGLVQVCTQNSCLDAPKCSAVCKAPYHLNAAGNNCVLCEDIASSEAASYKGAVSAGDYRAYTSTVYNSPVTFQVKVWTEDLNFKIIFYDATGKEIHREECTSTAKTNVIGVLNNSCGGKDDDDETDSYSTSYTANQVYVFVQEGGKVSSNDFGYNLTIGPHEKCSAPLMCSIINVNPDDFRDPQDINPGAKASCSTSLGKNGGTSSRPYYRPTRATADKLCQLRGYPKADDVKPFTSGVLSNSCTEDGVNEWDPNQNKWLCTDGCSQGAQVLTNVFCCQPK